MAPTGAEHRGRVPVGRLDQHPGRGRGHLGQLTAHHAAEPDDAGVVGDDEVLDGQRTVGAVEGREPLALARPSYADRALHLVGVVAVDRPAGLEHDVVGHVDGQGDRAHARLGDAAGQPVGRGRGGVEAGDGAGDEHRAALGIVDQDRVARVVGDRDLAQHRVVERRVEGERRLAGDAAQRQRVGAVGVDLELDDGVVEPEEGPGVVAGLPRAGRQHDDAVVVLAEAELAGGADHAGRDVAVGLARADLEVARQHTAGEHDDDEVAGREVVRTAHDALRLTAPVGVGDVHRAPVDRLAVLLRLGLHRQDPADDERAGDLVTWTLERLELEAEVGQRVGQLLDVEVVGQVDVVADPGHGGTHGFRSPFRRRTRSGRRPRRSHAGRRHRWRTSGCGRCPCRRRSRCSARCRCRTRSAPAG